MERMPAMLLIGPTGSGKTPLGEWLEAHGLGGRRCQHFDFGANLRGVAAGAIDAGLSAGELRFVRDVLDKGALLENETFPIARKILGAFWERCRAGSGDWLVLNGLPRHVGQADSLAGMLEVRLAVHLECDAATVRERLRLNSGGDRAERTDDDVALVAKKLAAFRERTLPLIEHYRQRGARVVRVAVGVRTGPGEMAAGLRVEGRVPPRPA